MSLFKCGWPLISKYLIADVVDLEIKVLTENKGQANGQFLQLKSDCHFDYEPCFNPPGGEI